MALAGQKPVLVSQHKQPTSRHPITPTKPGDPVPWTTQDDADIVVACRNPDLSFGGWRTDESPTITGGYGGHQATTRPKNAPLTDWPGRDLFTITIPMLLSRDGGSIHKDIDALDKLATGHRNQPPPPVHLFHVRQPAGATGKWVIQDPGWGDQWRRLDGTTYRALVTLTLLEFVDESELAASTTASRKGGHAIVRHYTVTAHDVSLKSSGLQHIAAKTMGDPKRWVDIAALNNLRSSGQLKSGMQLKLP